MGCSQVSAFTRNRQARSAFQRALYSQPDQGVVINDEDLNVVHIGLFVKLLADINANA
jgi:hypothetical protein